MVQKQIVDLDELLKTNAITPEMFKKRLDILRNARDKLTMQTRITIGKNSMDNPLFDCELEHWVGAPADCPLLTTTQVVLLDQIQKGLIAFGAEPLTLMFAGRKSKTYKGINFVAINRDNTFAWRKYDPSAGAGQNWVYIPGIGQMKTSDFVTNPRRFLVTAAAKAAEKAKEKTKGKKK